jgi:hypothetical protein
MANTFTLIETISVGSGGIASVTFNSIPQTYTDLLIKASVKTNRTSALAISDGLTIKFNNSTSTYSNRILYTDGSSAGSQAGSSAGITVSGNQTSNANIFSNSEMYICNYSASTFKQFSSENCAENNATFGYVIADGGLWSTTDPITSIVCVSGSAVDIMQYSVISLYGISKS